MIALSIGAGTRASELRSIRGKDLSGDGGNITISNRVVQIKSPWDRILSSLKPVDDEEFLFHPNAQNRNSKNFINNFADNLMRDPGSQRFQVARARARSFAKSMMGGRQRRSTEIGPLTSEARFP